jgi:hypothetical protein
MVRAKMELQSPSPDHVVFRAKALAEVRWPAPAKEIWSVKCKNHQEASFGATFELGEEGKRDAETERFFTD